MHVNLSRLPLQEGDYWLDIIEKYQKKAIKQKGLTAAEALNLFTEGSSRPFRVMAAASEIREHFKGREISLSGIVTSGKGIKSKEEWAELFKAIEGINGLGMKTCTSLGIIDARRARDLKAAGLYRYHHNLETSRCFFPNICTSHAYEEDIETIRAVKAAGLTVCAGGLIGLGEGITHRIELAETIRELGVASVPLNILNPIKRTPLERAVPLPLLEILMTITVFRFILPDQDIKLCGGKEKNLRQLLPLGIVAGANSLITGNYLTTIGRNSTLDQGMIADLGLRATREARPLCSCAAKGEKGRLRLSDDQKEGTIDSGRYHPGKEDES